MFIMSLNRDTGKKFGLSSFGCYYYYYYYCGSFLPAD